MLVAMWVWSTPALPCSFPGPDRLLVDDALSDGIAPEAPQVTVQVKRGQGPRPAGLFMQESTSCDDLGWVSLGIDAPDTVGLRLEVGEFAPVDFDVPVEPVVGPDATIVWIDEATDEQEPLSFVIVATPIDEGGDEGLPFEIRIEDPGGSSGGCNSSGLEGSVAGIALAALFLRRRYASS